MTDDAGHQRQRHAEQEPLLGRPGDAMQPEDDYLAKNFYLGTAVIAQLGVWVLVAIVWGAVFSVDITLFSGHPLAQAVAILFYIEAILILQPTHTADQKRRGTVWHAALNQLALLSAIAGLVVIEYNKGDHARFTSAHGRLGLATYLALALQASVGFTMYFLPNLYGGVDKAKKLYRYHRASGYVVVLLMLATVAAATFTGFNVNVLKISLWPVVVASLLIVVGGAPRIRKAKFGF